MSLLKSIKYFSISFSILFFCLVYAETDDSFIQTSSGKVSYQKTNGILLWEDIPFALPPIGNLRWKAPKEFNNTENIIKPKTMNFCHQEIGGEIQEIYEEGTEDCLYLDIRAPITKKKDLPVMFWIHGGGNTSGHKDFYDFSKLAKRENIIIVSTNYRLGPLGFFTHPAINDLNSGIDQTSNFGILDIILALEWVNKNIESFGGDSKNITIFGESAGGHNVLSLLVSPKAKGLFHKAISQSGYTKSSTLEDAYKSKFYNQKETSDSWTVLNKILIKEDFADNLDEADEYQEKTPKEKLRNILFEADAQELINLYGNTFETPLLTNDGIVIPEVGLLEALGSDEYLYKVPTIAGSNKDEIKLWIAFSEYFLETEETFLSKTLGIPKLKIKDEDKYEFYSSIRADAWQLRGVQEPLENIFYAGNKDVYSYRFDWDNLRNFFIGDFGKILGSAHALEIPMVSGDYNLADEFKWIVYPRSSSRRFVSKNMMNFWGNFAREGFPGYSTNAVRWTKFDPSSEMSILHIDERKNLRISKLDLNLDILVEDILNTTKLNNEEKCIILYETTNYVGDNSFERYVNKLPYKCSRDEAIRISEKNSSYIKL